MLTNEPYCEVLQRLLISTVLLNTIIMYIVYMEMKCVYNVLVLPIVSGREKDQSEIK